jgi:hypothetical protein
VSQSNVARILPDHQDELNRYGDLEFPVQEVRSMARVVCALRVGVEREALAYARIRGAKGELVISDQDWEMLSFSMLHLRTMIDGLHSEYYRVDDEAAAI